MLALADLWPWLAVAGTGALHGLNPATGWALVAVLGRQDDRVAVLRGLLPIAVGHLASVALVAGAVMHGLALDRAGIQWLAGSALLVLAVCHVARCRAGHEGRPTGHAGLALWSFLMATGHGAGLMLVPALMPLCFGSGAPAQAVSGTLTLALAALGVHMAAMLAVTGTMACVGRGVLDAALPRLRQRFRSRVA
ncbi:hypothetical protein [Niveibacterium sp. SC-1]|uniref:hypothetical protein n=1 Tax=Niveibacterium sp. SC-1 TaxID=3135646 RepID=UPI00311E2774